MMMMMMMSSSMASSCHNSFKKKNDSEGYDERKRKERVFLCPCSDALMLYNDKKNFFSVKFMHVTFFFHIFLLIFPYRCSSLSPQQYTEKLKDNGLQLVFFFLFS